MTVLVLGIPGTMSVSALVWIMTMGGPGDATMLLGPLAYNQAFQAFDYGQGAAIILAEVVVLLCAAGVFLLAARSTSARARRTVHSGTLDLPSGKA